MHPAGAVVGRRHNAIIKDHQAAAQAIGASTSEMPLEIVELSHVFPELLPLALLRRMRMRASKTVERPDESAEFPDLPSPINEALFRVGRLSLGGRRFWPAGTSLFAAFRRA